MTISPFQFNSPVAPSVLKVPEQLRSHIDALSKMGSDYLNTSEFDEVVSRPLFSWEKDLAVVNEDWANALGEVIHWMGLSSNEMISAQSSFSQERGEKSYEKLTNELKEVFKNIKRTSGGLKGLSQDVAGFMSGGSLFFNEDDLAQNITKLKNSKNLLVKITEKRINTLQDLLDLRNQASVCAAYILESLPELQSEVDKQYLNSDAKLSNLKNSTSFVHLQEEASKNRLLQRNKNALLDLSQRFKEHLIAGTASLEMMDRSLSDERTAFNQFNMMFDEGLGQIALLQTHRSSQTTEQDLTVNQEKLVKLIENNPILPKSETVPSGSSVELSLQERLARRRFVVEIPAAPPLLPSPEPPTQMQSLLRKKVKNVVGDLVLPESVKGKSYTAMFNNMEKDFSSATQKELITGSFILNPQPPREAKKFLGFNRYRGGLEIDASMALKRLINSDDPSREGWIQDINTVMADSYFRPSMSILDPNVLVNKNVEAHTPLKNRKKDQSPSFLAWLVEHSMSHPNGHYFGGVILNMMVAELGARQTIDFSRQMSLVYNLATGWDDRCAPAPLESLRLFELNFMPATAHMADFDGDFRHAPIEESGMVEYFLRFSQEWLERKDRLPPSQQELLQHKIDLWILEVLRTPQRVVKYYEKYDKSPMDLLDEWIKHTNRPEVVLEVNKFALLNFVSVGPLKPAQVLEHVSPVGSVLKLDQFAQCLFNCPPTQRNAWASAVLGSEKMNITSGKTQHMALLDDIQAIQLGQESLSLKTVEDIMKSEVGFMLNWASKELENAPVKFVKPQGSTLLTDIIKRSREIPENTAEIWVVALREWINDRVLVDNKDYKTPLDVAIQNDATEWMKSILHSEHYKPSKDQHQKSFKLWAQTSNFRYGSSADNNIMIRKMNEMNWWDVQSLQEMGVFSKTSKEEANQFVVDVLAHWTQAVQADEKYFERQYAKQSLKSVAEFLVPQGLPVLFSSIEQAGGIRKGNIPSSKVMKVLSSLILKMKELDPYCAEKIATDDLRNALFEAVSLNAERAAERTVTSSPGFTRRL